MPYNLKFDIVRNLRVGPTLQAHAKICRGCGLAPANKWNAYIFTVTTCLSNLCIVTVGMGCVGGSVGDVARSYTNHLTLS